MTATKHITIPIIQLGPVVVGEGWRADLSHLEQGEQIAEFIVRACNAHDDLVETLRDISIADVTGELKSLTTLNLSNNPKLQELPSQIGELKSLTTLYLRGNQLSSLPSWIGELKSLTTLDLSGNKLSDSGKEKLTVIGKQQSRVFGK